MIEVGLAEIVAVGRDTLYAAISVSLTQPVTAGVTPAKDTYHQKPFLTYAPELKLDVDGVVMVPKDPGGTVGLFDETPDGIECTITLVVPVFTCWPMVNFVEFAGKVVAEIVLDLADSAEPGMYEVT